MRGANKKEFGWIRKKKEREEKKKKGRGIERAEEREREKGEKGFLLLSKIYGNRVVGFRRSEK